MKVLVGKDEEIKEGRLKGLKADDKLVVVGRYKGSLYAMDGRCSHMGYDLSMGKFVDGVVTCPLHGAEFDLGTGKRLAHSGARDLVVYLISIEGDDVYLEM
jgi:nitrite reductase/ring-hydroxylating ferredoxin subunit